MTVLTITRDDLKKLCALDLTDTTPDAALDAVIAAEQSVFEYVLDPAVLMASSGSEGLRATLTLGVSEALSGSYLRRLARAPGATDDFHIGPLNVSASKTDSLPQIAERLAAQGLKRLEPFLRASKMVASDAVGGSPDGSSKTPLLAAAAATGSLFDASSGFDYGFSEEVMR